MSNHRRLIARKLNTERVRRLEYQGSFRSGGSDQKYSSSADFFEKMQKFDEGVIIIFQKVYNSIYQEYLIGVLITFGFSHKFIKLIGL